MKVNHYHLSDKEIYSKLQAAREFLANSHSDLTITDKGSYCTLKGTEISSFFLLPLSVSIQYSPDGQKIDEIYKFEILNSRHCSRTIISLSELSGYQWIKNIGNGFFLEKSPYYPHILSVLDEMSGSCLDSSPAFSCTGFHKIGNQWCYATSNLAIYADKLDWGAAYAP